MAGTYTDPRDRSFIADANAKLLKDVDADYAALGAILSRRGVDIDAVTATVANFGVAIPSWGVGTGGTRFARFPGKGEPRNVFEKLEDCAVIHSLTGATPTVSLHLPWDHTDDMPALASASEPRSGWASMRSIRTPSRIVPARSFLISSAVSRTPTLPCARRR